MGNLIPAQNVQAAAFAGAIVTLIEHVLSSYGYTLPPDVSSALTVLVAVITAHLWDIFTGQLCKPQQGAQAQKPDAPGN